MINTLISNYRFSLRNPAHTFTTEAIAMFFGRMASNPQFLLDMKLADESESKKVADESFKVLRLEQLTFSRWAQVMYRFEKGLYDNPDQDLNKLWWDLVEKYQMLKRPEGRNQPDWASKIHIATSPCYYHNYLLGELLASQLNHYVAATVLKSTDFKQSYYGKTEVGKYLTDNVFMPGARWNWNEMIEKATGEKLTAKYYSDQFVN
ncbi:MAG: M2 family metallopeptidase [Bacteroidales bacterium]|nr:M2 family metallopeptidase [Bacteroidales bacterium]